MYFFFLFRNFLAAILFFNLLLIIFLSIKLLFSVLKIFLFFSFLIFLSKKLNSGLTKKFSLLLNCDKNKSLFVEIFIKSLKISSEFFLISDEKKIFSAIF